MSVLNLLQVKYGMNLSLFIFKTLFSSDKADILLAIEAITLFLFIQAKHFLYWMEDSNCALMALVRKMLKVTLVMLNLVVDVAGDVKFEELQN